VVGRRTAGGGAYAIGRDAAKVNERIRGWETPKVGGEEWSRGEFWKLVRDAVGEDDEEE